MQEQQKIIWKANPGPQEQALKKIEKEVLYGGARGGGKTDAGIIWLSFEYKHPKYRGLVIRRNSDDLFDWLERAKILYRSLGATFVNRTFRFPSGAIINTGHLADEDAYERYQGHEYQRILIEELTHIPNLLLYLKLIGSCRSTVPGISPQVFCTSNPGNAGHEWVKERFIDTASLFTYSYTDRNGEQKTAQMGSRYTDPEGNTRVFVPATVYDNPVLLEADPGYLKYLQSLPEDLRKKWLEGDWGDYDIEGAYYTASLQQAAKEGRITTVNYDPVLPVHTWWDLGVGDSTVILFFQTYGLEWRLIDYHEANGEGLDYYAKILQGKNYVYGQHWAPHDIKVKEFSTGQTRYETAQKLGIRFEIVPMYSIDDGINAVRMHFPKLWIDKDKCKPFIRAIKNYRKDFNERLQEFKAKPRHDWASHAADALRYWAITNFKPAKKQDKQDSQYNKYDLI